MEWEKRITTKVLGFFSPRKDKKEEMIQRVHVVDLHKRSATISVMNREGKEIAFIRSCYDLNNYIRTLGHEDAVVFETGLGSFYWPKRYSTQENRLKKK